MSAYTQTGRPLSITTPLGKDVLLLTGVEGRESVSGLFRFSLDLIAAKETAIPFDEILGKNVTVEIEVPPDGRRFLNGIVARFRQGRQDAHFTHYVAELVPRLWLLTRRVTSRIFQRMTVPEILEAVLAGVSHRIETTAPYEPRDFCVQYRESDFAFVSRLMEEEGIRYFFVHEDGSHVLVVRDEGTDHPAVPGPEEVAWEEVLGGTRDGEMRVCRWEKEQEVRSDLTTLRDHCFELPGKDLESQQPAVESVVVGTREHRTKLLAGEPLEVYDFPGGYAQRFDGVDRGGAPRPEELPKIFPDGLRTVRLRMEAEEMAGLVVRGTSGCSHFAAGHRFTLCRHFDADGPYLLTAVEHRATLDGDYRSGEGLSYRYENDFEAIPAGLPYRPPRATPRPVIAGTQTATVVGPAGEELFCDRYGRVKVQFHWDREGKKDLDSSCWVRVAQTWAGRSWGAFFWPRVGNEVVVAFEEGDPDQPVVVGSVYNAENMPPFELPLRKELAGIKSASVRGFANQHFNGLVFVDTKGAEHLAIHSQRTMTFNSELDKSFHSGRNKHEAVSTFSTQTVGSLPGGGGSGGGPDVVGTDGSLPGGGGSGGGIDDQKDFLTFQGNAKWHPLGFVQPTGTLGLQAGAVYGESLAAVCGLNRSLTLGSSLTTIINPAFLSKLGAWESPPLLDAVMGTGAGGGATFTLGSNTSLVLGKNYNIFSEAATDIDIKESRGAKVVCVILAIVAYVFMALYWLIGQDIFRTVWTILYEGLAALLLVVLMYIVAVKQKANEDWSQAWESLFEPVTDLWRFRHMENPDAKKDVLGILAGLNTVVNALLPVAMAALGDAANLFTGIWDAAEDW